MDLRVTPVPIGPVAVGARSFVRGGERRLVAIVKATFDMTPDGPMRLRAPRPLSPDDLALRLTAAQVISVGVSHAPADARVGVRLAVARGENMLIDLRVDVPAGSPAGFGGIPREAPKRRARRGSCPAEVADQALHASLPPDFDDAYFLWAPPEQCTEEAWSGGELVALVHLHPRFATIRTYLPRGRAAAILQTDRGARVPVKLRCDTLILRPETLQAELVWRGDVRVDEESLRGARVGGAWSEGPEVVFPDLATTSASAGGSGVGAPLGEASAPPAPALVDADDAGPSTMRLDLPDEAPPRAKRKRADATMLLEPESPGALGGPPAAHPFEARSAEARSADRPRGHAATMLIAPDVVLASPRPAGDGRPAGDVDEASPNTVLMPGGVAAPGGTLVATLGAEEPTTDVGPDAPRSLPFQRAMGRRKIGLPGAEPTPSSRVRRAPLPGSPWAKTKSSPPPPVRGNVASTMVLELPQEPAAPPPIAPPPAAPAPIAPPPAAPTSPSPAELGGPAPAAPPLEAPPAPAGEARPPGNPWRQDPESEPAAPAASPAAKAPRARVSFRSDLYKKFKK